MENIVIRKIEEKDRDSYLTLTEKFYKTDGVMADIPCVYRERCFEECIRSDVYAECYLAEIDNTAAGYVLLAKTFSQEGGGLTVWVEEIYVLPEFRGKGVAKNLLSFVIDAHPVVRYRLEVEPDNENAIDIYKKLGFYFIPYQEMVKVNENH